jgi:lipopolysaccharide transport system ATP-binding protein
MSTVIKIENLYKEYRLGVIGHDTLYRDLQSLWAKIRGREDPNSLIGSAKNVCLGENILALNDINLEVKAGEVLGIIGRNGAGKSTLLKVLSRVTAPTKGCIKVKGRVASLLEVSTGFHSELTGRENIYLNGAINGMNRKEVSLKLDQIVDFSGVEQFLDTPVKRYSSGMHVRLGFSVAAHLEPEILVVDEVLAVGDVDFQKKCLGKMDSVAKEGRTILFVSHQMQAITNLCHSVVLLDQGKISHHGNTGEMVSLYLKNSTKPENYIMLNERNDRQGIGQIRWVDTWIENTRHEKLNMVISGEDFFITGVFEVLYAIPKPKLTFAFGLYNYKAEQVTDLTNDCIDKIFSLDGKLKIQYKVRTRIKRAPLTNGLYTYNMMLRNNDDVQDYLQNCYSFQVVDGDFYGTGKTIKRGQGVLFEQDWEMKPMENQL